MASKKNKPKDATTALFGKDGKANRNFWSPTYATTRGRSFYADIETTALGEGVMNFGPERADKILRDLNKIPTLAKQLEYFRELDEYKYIKHVGLAQYVMFNENSPGVKNPGNPPWPLGGGYTTWGDNAKDMLLTDKIDISEFAQRRNIAKRSLDALRAGKAVPEKVMLSKVAHELQEASKWGRGSIRGWNIWFDIIMTTAFSVRHYGHLQMAGFDPLFMIKAMHTPGNPKGFLNADSAEESYFDLLRWKGLRNQEWASENLRYGKMFASVVGATPGSPININEDIKRVAEGKPSHLRGRYGWKQEILEDIYNRFGDVHKGLTKWSFPDNLKLADLDVHDALRDVPIEVELTKRFRITNKVIRRYDRKWKSLSKAFPGYQRDMLISALGFAEAGLLGEDVQGGGDAYVESLKSNKAKLDEIITRTSHIWGDVSQQTDPMWQPKGPHRVIDTPHGSYKRLLWARGLKNSYLAGDAKGIYDNILKGAQEVSEVVSGATSSVKRTLATPTAIKAGAALFGIWALYNAFGRKNEKIDANIPDNYIRGQQGQKVIDVPWASPWVGPEKDQNSALGMLMKGGVVALGAYALYNLPRALSATNGINAYYTARVLEDLTPFRVGRIFNLSGHYSSFLGGDSYGVLKDELLKAGQLTPMGKQYGRALGISDQNLSAYIDQHDGLGFARRGNSAFMEIDLGQFGGKKSIRFFESASRIGHAYAVLDATPGSVRIHQDKTMATHSLLRRSKLANLLYRVPILRGFIEDYAVRPVWETDPFRWHQKELAGDVDIMVPGYRRFMEGGGLRHARGFVLNSMSTAYDMTRRITARLGITLPPATTPGGMLKGFGKVAAIGTASAYAFSLFGAPVTGAVHNVYERARLWQARISDFTGLTSIRKQFPEVQATAPLAILGTAAILPTAIAYKYRAQGLLEERKNRLTGSAAGNRIWRKSDITGKATRYPVWEEIYHGSADQRDELLTRTMFQGNKKYSGLLSLLNFKNLNTRGKTIMGAIAGMTALLAPFALGTQHTQEEWQEIFSGERKVPIQRGRWWEFGNTPYEGGRTAYWRMHQSARRKFDASEEVPGGATGIWAGIKSIFNPYWREKEAYYDRPYPVSGPMLEEVPFVGHLLARTIGRWLKPPKLMHTDQWDASKPYEQYGEDYAPMGQGSAGAAAELFLNKQVSLMRDPNDRSKRGTDVYGRKLRLVTVGGSGPETGIVTRIIDGDTIEVVTDRGRERVRIANINAPEVKSHSLYSTGDTGPQFKGLPSPVPLDPYGLASQVREAFYRGTELAGLRGFISQTTMSNLIGGESPAIDAAYLQPSRLGFSPIRQFWEADLGGIAGMSEFYRRLYPRPERGQEVNPIANMMPSWIPGEDYFLNLKVGDPYSKIPYGGERLPGAGYEKINPEVAGIHPEDYPAFHKYKILSDVAPWSKEARKFRSLAYRDAYENPSRLAELDEIDRQVDLVKKKKNFKNYGFTGDTDKVRGMVSSVGPGGEIALEGYPNHTFSLAGIRFGLSSSADQIRNANNVTRQEAVQRAYELSSERQAYLNNLLAGEHVTLEIPEGGLLKPDVEATVYNGLTNINRLVVEEGYAGSEGGAPTAGFIQSLYGGLTERLGHLPQKVPGPWMFFTKLFNQADPMEEYRRSELYGSSMRLWNNPWQDFARPYMYGLISKLTPGEFVPMHTEKRREMDMLFDRLAFVKHYTSGDMAKATKTMAGMDIFGHEALVSQAMPYRERPYFEAFAQETDPTRRKRILSMVSTDMQRALAGQWTSQYAQVTGQAINREETAARMQMAAVEAVGQISKLGGEIPARGNPFWHQGVDFEDVKAVMVQHEGLDRHEFNIWDDRINSLTRKPYLYGSDPMFTSRRMPIPAGQIGQTLDQSTGGPNFVYETISSEIQNQVTVNNKTDYSDWDQRLYHKRKEEFIR